MTSILRTYTGRLVEFAADIKDAALIVTSTAALRAYSTTLSPNSQSGRSNRPSLMPSGTTAFNGPSTQLACAWLRTSTWPIRLQSPRKAAFVRAPFREACPRRSRNLM